MMRLLSRFSYKIIAVSESVRSDLIQKFYYPNEKVQVVNNPIDCKQIRLEANKNETNLQKYGRYILSIGRLNIQKDFQTLLKSFSKICDDYDLNLVILGEGNQRKNLQETANSLGISDGFICLDL